MLIVLSVQETQRLCLQARREGRRIGLVPTMGCLHEGHASLLRRARPACGLLVASLFVNPTQFGPGEDYARYPRDRERDAALCRAEGVDVLFCPAAEEMYAADCSVTVQEDQLSTGLCGASRPGHFRGVATVVAKLFNIVQPDVAVFGQKDAQQVRVIRRMVRDLNFAVAIDVAPTVREPDGLALSSRNAYLSPDERRRAAWINRALALADRLSREGLNDPAALRERMGALLEREAQAAIEYLAIVDDATLEPVARIDRPALVAVAVRIGHTRLIDNTVIGPAGG